MEFKSKALLFSIPELSKKIKDYIASKPNLDFIVISGHNEHKFSEPLTRKVLDSIYNEKPMIILRYDAHANCLNSKACELIGLTKDTECPSRGRIELD